MAREQREFTEPNTTRPAGIDRRGFLKLMAAGAALTPLSLAGCGSNDNSSVSAAAAIAGSDDLPGTVLTFVGDDALPRWRWPAAAPTTTRP